MTHRYTQRLLGYYEEHGVSICASCQGLYGAAISPSLQMAAIIVQVLMMAEQGVKNIRLHFAAHGNLAQDVSTARVLQKLAEEYLKKYGYNDIRALSVGKFFVSTISDGSRFRFRRGFYEYPYGQACAVTQANDIRTVAEAKGIPTKEDTAYSFRTAKAMENFLQTQKIEVDKKALEIETQMAEQEVRCIVDKVLEFGDGDVVVGTIKAIKSGVLDNPFATNPASPCKVMSHQGQRGRNKVSQSRQSSIYHRHTGISQRQDCGKRKDKRQEA